MRALCPGRIEFGDVGFCGGKKTGEPEEKPSEQGENQQRTQGTYGTRSESNSGDIGGRRALSPLRQPCSPIRKLMRKLVQVKSSCGGPGLGVSVKSLIH